jgi:hypothetical protein
MDRKRKRRRTKLHYRQDRRDPSRTEELAEFLENTSPPPSQRVAWASRRSSPAAARGGKTGWEGVAAARVWEDGVGDEEYNSYKAKLYYLFLLTYNASTSAVHYQPHYLFVLKGKASTSAVHCHSPQ